MSAELSSEIEAAAESIHSTVPAATAPTLATTDAVPNAPGASIAIANPPTKPSAPEYPPLPAYALTYAPLLWLHEDEHYWPGDPLQHLGRCMPQNKDGTSVVVPDGLIGRTELLELPNVDKQDVYLCLAVSRRCASEVAFDADGW